MQLGSMEDTDDTNIYLIFMSEYLHLIWAEGHTSYISWQPESS